MTDEQSVQDSPLPSLRCWLKGGHLWVRPDGAKLPQGTPHTYGDRCLRCGGVSRRILD